MKTKFYEQGISKHHGGFGMYQAGEINGDGWENESDLLFEISKNLGVEIFELGKDTLPEGIDDISGRIYGKYGKLFGYFQEEQQEISAQYFSIMEK